MTETDNTTEKSAEKETVNTAPYMKKDSTPESSKSNMVIPLVLVLVSAIVIMATFYKGEDNSPVEETNIATDAIEQDPSQVTVASTVLETQTGETDADTEVATVETTTSSETTTTTNTADVIEITEVAIVTEPETSSSPEDNTNANENSEEQQQINNSKAAMQTPAAVKNTARMPVAYSQNQYQPYAQNPAKAHTQEQAQKYNEIMQQRRQAYKKEMESRQKRFEEARTAHQKRRAEMIAAQKAEFQRMEKSRIETQKKIQYLHDQISQLHKEIHQLIHESNAATDNSVTE